MDMQTFPAFTGLSREEIDGFVRSCEVISIPAGKTLIEQDGPADKLYFVVDGQLRVFVRAPRGEQEVASMAAPCLVGELEFFCSDTWAANVTVTGREANALVVDYADLRRRLDAGDVVALKVVRNFAQVLARRLFVMNRKVVEIADEHAHAVPAVRELQTLQQKLFGEWSV